MRFVRHPFVERDLMGMVDHIIAATGGDVDAAARRLAEVEDLLRAITASPSSGVRLSGTLQGWLVRHGGTGQRLTIVFRPDVENERIYLAMIAFGGRDWTRAAVGRRSVGGS